MITSIKMLFATCLLTASFTQAAICSNVNYRIFDLYVTKAVKELAHAGELLQWEDHGPREIIWSGQSFADALYPKQKAALKNLLEEINSMTLNTVHDGTNELFKHEVYNQWKRNFKNNYTASVKNNNFFAWGWLHKPVNFIIHE